MNKIIIIKKKYYYYYYYFKTFSVLLIAIYTLLEQGPFHGPEVQREFFNWWTGTPPLPPVCAPFQGGWSSKRT